MVGIGRWLNAQNKMEASSPPPLPFPPSPRENRKHLKAHDDGGGAGGGGGGGGGGRGARRSRWQGQGQGRRHRYHNRPCTTANWVSATVTSPAEEVAPARDVKEMPLDFLDPSDSSEDLISVALASFLLLLSAASFAAVLLRFRCRRRQRLHDLLSPLWPVRLLLPLFACLWSLSQLLRSPVLRRRLPVLRRHPDLICHAYLVSSQHLAEPAFLVILLFLVRASTRLKRASSSSVSAFAAAIAAALLAVLPFLLLHSLYLFLALSTPRLGLSHYNFASSSSSARCAYPLFGTVLIAAFAAVYVPIFVSASWAAVSVVINRRLRRRLYVLCAAVVVGLSVQVAALALSILWNPDDHAFQWLSVIETSSVVAVVAVGEAILVFRPVIDALSVGEVVETAQREPIAGSTCVARAQQPNFSPV
ncbi:hypothetical protein ZIOFF_065501 [Zingiber officinale]|uniref:Uncharacterized protein n=1 Tax=Zingiber officinale TaxID=94328 RepID=A0A8J5F066_ZINOF|nr:hypothetical protein ZIOFF_065501 [Zingiber officinale]